MSNKEDGRTRQIILNKIENFFLDCCNIKKGDGIIVGVSGGADSMCLLHLLCLLRQTLGLKIWAVHINHMLRGEEANQDQELVESICRKWDVPVYAFKKDVGSFAKEKRMGLEEAGRKVRYDYFRSVKEETRARFIATAHNKDDQAETILMNIFRGTGLDGLGGMEYISGDIIRPLLDTGREEIEKYCEENKIEYVVESSNLGLDYLRNRVRLKLIPQVLDVTGTNPVQTISRMAELLRDDKNFLDSVSYKEYKKVLIRERADGVEINLSEFNTLHRAIKKRIIRLIYFKVKGRLTNFENKHVEDVIALADRAATGKQINLPGSVTAGVSYNTLRLSILEKKEKINVTKKINVPGTTFVEEFNIKLSTSVVKYDIIDEKERKVSQKSQKSRVQFFDYEKLKEGINIRSRNNGDEFRPYGLKGTKKLKKFFIDEKIPREKRDAYPLITLGNEVVWILGYKISDKFKVTENTINILKMEYEKI